MASCPKCGRQKVGKDTQGRRSCRQCGILPGPARMDRSGIPRDVPLEISCRAIPTETTHSMNGERYD